MNYSRRALTILVAIALALAVPVTISAPVNALGESLAGLSSDLLTDQESRYGPRYEYASRPLVAGDRGTDVARLQRFLTVVGLGTKVTGHYALATRRSVKRWEARDSQRRDGEVSRREARKLQHQALRARAEAWGDPLLERLPRD